MEPQRQIDHIHAMAEERHRGIEGELYDLRVALVQEEERGMRNVLHYREQVAIWQGKYYQAQYHLVRANWGCERLSRKVQKLRMTFDNVARHAKWEQWRADAMYITISWGITLVAISFAVFGGK